MIGAEFSAPTADRRFLNPGARWRFARAVAQAAGLAAAVTPARLAYADPPYPGKAHLYRGHLDYAGKVDDAALIGRLAAYDGWPCPRQRRRSLALCPPGVRVAAWRRGDRGTASWEPVSAWEPVIYRPGQPVDPATAGRRPDSLVCGVASMRTLPGRVMGTKPSAVCAWIFTLIGAAPGDSLDDLYPGSGAVSRAWAVFTGQRGPATGTTSRDICGPFPPGMTTAAWCAGHGVPLLDADKTAACPRQGAALLALNGQVPVDRGAADAECPGDLRGAFAASPTGPGGGQLVLVHHGGTAAVTSLSPRSYQAGHGPLGLYVKLRNTGPMRYGRGRRRPRFRNASQG